MLQLVGKRSIVLPLELDLQGTRLNHYMYDLWPLLRWETPHGCSLLDSLTCLGAYFDSALNKSGLGL